MTEEEAKSIIKHILDYREYHIQLTEEIVEALHVLMDSLENKEGKDGQDSKGDGTGDY